KAEHRESGYEYRLGVGQHGRQQLQVEVGQYKFGVLLIRPLWRTLAGSRAARRSVVHPPQPKMLPTTGNLKDCLPDLWIQCFPLVEKYGPLVKLRIFDDVLYVVADPEIVDIVNQIPDKRLPSEVFGCPALAGQGVFIADGQRWEFARQTFQALWGALGPLPRFLAGPRR
ncbi:cypD, partial [Symbiodinium sp. CCMP2456]